MLSASACFFSYSPELNPDELLNPAMSADAVGRQRPENQSQMIENIRSYLRSTNTNQGCTTLLSTRNMLPTPPLEVFTIYCSG